MVKVFQKPGNKAHKMIEDVEGPYAVSQCGIAEMEDEVVYIDEEDVHRINLCLDCFPRHRWQGRSKF